MNYRNSKKICRTLGTMVFAGTMLVGCKSSDNIKADVKITLSDDSCKCDSDSVSVNKNTIAINDEGTYVVSGSLSDGQIIVDAKDKKVEIILDNTEITSKTSAAIYVKKADKVSLVLADGSKNTLSNTEEFVSIDDNNIDSVIFSKDNLVLSGDGELTINSAYGHGIVSKDELEITSGTYNVTSESHGLSAKDCVKILAGKFNLTTGKDGIHAENTDDNAMGFVYIEAGEFVIDSDGDGIDASNYVQIEDGKFEIAAGDGEVQNMDMLQMPEGMPKPEDGQMPGNDRMPRRGDGEMPEGMQKPEDGQMPEKGDFMQNGGQSSDSTSTKGIKADVSLTVNGGEILISKSYEGLESASIIINDGKIDITSSDDGMNASGENDEILLEINGGTISVNASGDGVDSNGDIIINGGIIYIDGPTSDGDSPVDFGEKSSFYTNGGTVVAVGSSGMAEKMDEKSSQAGMLVVLDETMEAGEVTLSDSNGNQLVSYETKKSYRCVTISCEGLKEGETYTLTTSGKSTEIEMTDLIYSNKSR